MTQIQKNEWPNPLQVANNAAQDRAHRVSDPTIWVSDAMKFAGLTALMHDWPRDGCPNPRLADAVYRAMELQRLKEGGMSPTRSLKELTDPTTAEARKHLGP